MENGASSYRRFLDGDDNGIVEIIREHKEGLILFLNRYVHSYEDQIAAVKESYNNSQMHHIMDEAEERGKQIAKALEKSEPKTEEERKEEQREEALGTDENKGVLSEILEDVSETAEQTFGVSDMETENLIEENEIERMQMRFDVRA